MGVMHGLDPCIHYGTIAQGDQPATWRQIDQENSMNVLQEHINDLKTWGYLGDIVDTELMTYSISGALNELALNYSQTEPTDNDDKIINTITQLVYGFRK